MFHVGSQCTDPLAWRRAMARCSAALRELERHRLRLEMLNIGGGLPARYVGIVPTIEEIAEEIGRGLERLPYRPPLLCAEPGRFLVAESAVLAATVIGIEDRGRERWAYLDVGGYNGLMETLQTGGRWHFPLATSRADEATVPHTPFTVTGPSCDSSDTMFYGVDLPATLAAEDRIYIGSTGAYTLSYASHFNGFPPPTPLFVNARRRLPERRSRPCRRAPSRCSVPSARLPASGRARSCNASEPGGCPTTPRSASGCSTASPGNPTFLGGLALDVLGFLLVAVAVRRPAPLPRASHLVGQHRRHRRPGVEDPGGVPAARRPSRSGWHRPRPEPVDAVRRARRDPRARPVHGDGAAGRPAGDRRHGPAARPVARRRPRPCSAPSPESPSAAAASRHAAWAGPAGTPPLLAEPLLWAAVAFAALGLLLFSRGLQRGSAVAVSAPTMAAETLVPAAVGVAFLGDHARPDLAWLALAGLALTLAAALLLTLRAPERGGSGRPGVMHSAR